MKKTIKLISLLLAVVMTVSAPFTVLASTKEKSKYTSLTYTHQSRFDDFEIRYGIDVSEHNGIIDFNKVKADGIGFVFIRVGYTGYTKSKFSLNYDKNYKIYLDDAIAAGLKVGVYWYSQAVNTDEATQEALMLIKGIRDYSLDMPVVYDYEFADTSAGRLDSAKLSKQAKTDNALAFLDTVSAEGYTGCLYASENFLLNEMNAEDVASVYQIWLANYSTKTTYDGSITYWQHTSRGSVKGIDGNCDINFWYVDKKYIQLDSEYYTGDKIKPQPVIKDDATGAILTEGVDYVLSYTNNTNIGTATIKAKGKGDYEDMLKYYKFEIVPEDIDELVFVSATETSLKYKWKEVPGACEYKIYLRNNNLGKVYYKRVKTNKATISNLTPGNKYTVKVVAGIKNSSGGTVWGNYSAEDKRCTKSSVVTGLAVAAKTTKSITIKWNSLPEADSYNVYMYSDKRESYKLIANVKASRCKYKVSGLKAGSIYKFKVSAVTEGEEGKRSKYFKASTSPNQVKLSSVKANPGRKLTVSWKSAKCSGYELQWSTSKSFSENFKSVNVSGRSKTITTAQSRKTYYVRVRPYTKVNGSKVYGKWSQAKSIKTR